MDERFTGLPEPPPGGDRPVDLGARVGGGGRGRRVLLIGCGVLFFLVGVAAIVFLLKAQDFLGWVFGELEQTVMERVPEDLPAADRARLQHAFDEAVDDIVSGRADPAAMQRLQGELRSIVAASGRGPDARLTRQQVADITAALEAVAGTAEGPGTERPQGGGGPRPAAPGAPPPS